MPVDLKHKYIFYKKLKNRFDIKSVRAFKALKALTRTFKAFKAIQ